MGASPEDLFRCLDELGIAHETIDHPPLFTVEDGRGWWHKIPGLHCKNLFLKDKKDKVWLLVMPGEKRADINALEKIIGSARLSFGKPDLLMEILGLTPGSVTPFGLINDKAKRATVLLDAELLRSDKVNFHPLQNTRSTTVRSADLLKFIKALGYEPLIIEQAEKVNGNG